MPIGPRYRSVVGRRLGITSDSELEVDGQPITGSGISEVADDTSPTLGGSLDGGGFDITNVDDATFDSLTVTDEAYDESGWNGDLSVPTKNAVRDKIETLAPLASPTFTGTLTSGGKFVETVVALSDGATPALDASLGNVFTLDAAGDRTIAVPSNATSGQKIVIRHYANTSARTLALNTGAGGFRFGTDITALTETSASKTDYIGCVYNAADSKWDVVAYVKGY